MLTLDLHHLAVSKFRYSSKQQIKNMCKMIHLRFGYNSLLLSMNKKKTQIKLDNVNCIFVSSPI